MKLLNSDCCQKFSDLLLLAQFFVIIHYDRQFLCFSVDFIQVNVCPFLDSNQIKFDAEELNSDVQH